MKRFISTLMETITRSVLVLVGILLLLAAAELQYKSVSVEGIRIFSWLAAFAGVSLLVLQWQYYRCTAKRRLQRKIIKELKNEIAGFSTQVKALERRRKVLVSRVDELTAQSNIDNAAASSDSLDDFMNNIARLAKDNNGARELTVFSGAGVELLPIAYYQLAETTELCLTFKPAGAAVIADNLQVLGKINSSLLKAKGLNVNNAGRQIVVSGELLYDGSVAGSMSLSVLNADPENLPPRAALRRLIMSVLAGVNLDDSGIYEAYNKRSTVAASGCDNLSRIATVLQTGAERLGAIRMGFAHSEEGNIYEQQQVLASAARHVAKALKNERIYEQAIKDSLTGLYNKRHMLATLEHHFGIASRHGNYLSLILLDIDHFKNVNDTWGHLTGDIILREVGAIFAETARSCDVPCRYGGEELAIVLPEGDIEGTYQLAERIRQAIEIKEFKTENGESLKITASLGVACFMPGMNKIEDLISIVDQALYVAKEGGRNQVVRADALNQKQA